MTSEETRPRYGHITRADGTTTPVVFRPTDKPDTFEAVNAGAETPAQVGRGDKLHADVIGAGQSIVFYPAGDADAV